MVELVARADVDRPANVVHLRELRTAKVSFPAAQGAARAWRATLERHLPAAYDAPLDGLEEALAIARTEKPRRQAVRNPPPDLVFRTSPAMLVYVDGAPQLRPVEGTALTRIVNTRPLLVHDARRARYDLRLLDGWLEAPSLDGPWAVAAPRPELDAALAWAAKQPGIDLLEVKPAPEQAPASGERVPPPTLAAGTSPDVVVATRPTELIVTEGPPQLEAIPDTNLLYWKNTSSDVLVDSATGLTYVLAAGRWFRAGATSGPWTFVDPKQLPPDFGRIRPDHPKATVLAAVSGTAQAKEAVLANAVPQTATVKRAEATFTPAFDEGTPRLERIEGTPLSYVANSPAPIIMVAPTSWYAVRDGVWFTAPSANGARVRSVERARRPARPASGARRDGLGRAGAPGAAGAARRRSVRRAAGAGVGAAGSARGLAAQARARREAQPQGGPARRRARRAPPPALRMMTRHGGRRQLARGRSARTSRTFSASAAAVNGFGMKRAPRGSAPRRTNASSV